MSPLVNTPVEEIPQIHADLQAAFRTGKTKPVAYRKEQILHMVWMLKDNMARFAKALKADLGRPEIMGEMLDVVPTIQEAMDCYANVETWAKTEKARWSLNWFATSPAIRKEPKGVVLIIAPFNFPVFLLLSHAANAIAAGNCVLLKPSELVPATCQLLAELVPKYMDPDTVRLVNGDIPVVTKLLELPWDHILYTGSARVAKIVCNAAAKHLTPVTTELGGKCPVFIDPKCDMELAARRVLWGKVTNAGQVCVSPDYVLVPYEAQDHFVEEIKKMYKTFFPGDPKASDSYSRIVSPAHARRLKRYIDATQGRIVLGGEVDAEARFVAPTIIRDVFVDDATMEEELFGPILPIVPVRDVDEAIRIVNAKEHPLALYVFTKDDAFKEKVFNNTQSGGAIVNEVMLHVGTTGLPFGGIGPSGSGYLTGKHGFETFSHLRCTLNNPRWVDTYIMHPRFPPYTPKKIEALRKMLQMNVPPRPGTVSKSYAGRGLWALFTLVSVVMALVVRSRAA